jgi:hypothetical protein
MARQDNSPGTIINKGGGGPQADLVFPAGDKLNMGMLFKFVQFKAAFGDGRTTKSVTAKNLTQAHIALPLPENIQDNLNLNYETTDLGAVAAGIGTGEAVSNAFSQAGVGAAASTFAGRVGGDAQFLARTLAQLSGPVSGALNISAGNVPNPFTTAIFKSVELRRHNFNFRLVPETPEDSVVIRDIINRFKLESLPKRQGNFLMMPSEIEIEFFGTNSLFGMARCVIQGMTVNYNPSNQPAFFKNSGSGLFGAPQAVELQLQLTEIEQLTGDRFEGYGGNASTISSQAAESSAQADRPGNSLRDNAQDPVRRLIGRGG